MRWLLCILSLAALSGCSYFHPYRPDIEQGNVMSQEHVGQVKLGMTRAQVIKIMGTPALSQFESSDQMNYVYTFSPDSGAYQYWRVTISFRHGVVSNIAQEQYTGHVRHAI